MNTKLTLTIEQTIIERAKKYAQSKNRSLSGLIENYLKALTKEETISNVETFQNVKALKGSFKLPENFDYKKEPGDRLSEKYL
ncbi:MAG: DUF6364 family protein [Chitinophagaceae bacterium]